MNIFDSLSAGDVILDLDAKNKSDLLEILAMEAARRLDRSEQEILDTLRAREELGSTGLGKGVAVPHTPISGVTSPLTLFVRLRRPIDVDARDAEPVDLVFLVLWPTEARKGLLEAMSDISRIVREPQYLRRLRLAGTPEEAAQLLRHKQTAVGQSGPDRMTE